MAGLFDKKPQNVRIGAEFLLEKTPSSPFSFFSLLRKVGKGRELQMRWSSATYDAHTPSDVKRKGVHSFVR